MSSLLVVTGPPGAGKSTVAAALAERFERSALVEGDALFRFVRRGKLTPWLPEARHQNKVVTEAAASAAGRFARGGYPTIYDGIVGPWFLPIFLGATELDRLDYVVLLPPLERCVERVATRVGHGFTDGDATVHMHAEFARADVMSRHVLVDPPDGAGAVADLIVAAVAAGTLGFPI